MAVLHMFRLISRCRVVRPIWMEFREMIRKNIWEFAVSEMFRLWSQAVNKDIFKVNYFYWTNVLLFLVSNTHVSPLSQSPVLYIYAKLLSGCENLGSQNKTSIKLKYRPTFSFTQQQLGYCLKSGHTLYPDFVTKQNYVHSSRQNKTGHTPYWA